MEGLGFNQAEIVKQLARTLDDYIGELQARKYAPKTIGLSLQAVKTLLKVNSVQVPNVYAPMSRVVYGDRSPTPEELQLLLDLADLRGKVIISILALAGLREGTLAKLKYRHVKKDLERGIIPLQIHIEADITKGKYGSYDTFLAKEAVEFLRLYLDYRRRGSPCGKIPPETITETSPLIRNATSAEPRHLRSPAIYDIVHNLYIKAGLIQPRKKRRHELRVHSIRKYFRTQLAALGMPVEYIEYMMGHKMSTYHDIQMKGIDFLRNVYTASGLSIKPKTKVSRVDMLKEIVRAWGLDPEKVLVKETLSQPHRVLIDATNIEQDQTRTLSKALKKILRKELLANTD